MSDDCRTRFVISILVADRPGILRDITSAITDMQANIDDVRQTVVEGYFTVILTATFRTARDAGAIRSAIGQYFPEDEANIAVRPFEPVSSPALVRGGRTYVLTITGPDRPGILKRATTLLAGKGINIEDWACLMEGPQVTYLAELTVPRNLVIGQVRQELRHALDALDLSCNIQHQNIFRATNEIGPIRSLLKEDDHA